MDFAYTPSTGYQPGSPRERWISSTLSLCIIALIVAAALISGTVIPEVIKTQRLVSFSVDVADTDKTARTSEAAPKASPAAASSGKTAQVEPKPLIAIQRTVEKPDPLEGIPGFIKLSKSDLAAANIGQMRGRSRGSDSNGNGTASRTARGQGDGPGGVTLHDAQWHRKPSNAELSTYMPKNGGISGWGIIACQVIERYHVDNCHIMAESPRGSGFGRAVQNAAWQFLVKPPRINNQPQIGEWVRIRIDYTVTTVRGGTDPLLTDE